MRKGVDFIVAEEKSVGGQLGRPSGARFRTYARLKRYAEAIEGSLFATPALAKAIEESLPLSTATVGDGYSESAAALGDIR